jgi:hypothetical protein
LLLGLQKRPLASSTVGKSPIPVASAHESEHLAGNSTGSYSCIRALLFELIGYERVDRSCVRVF